MAGIRKVNHKLKTEYAVEPLKIQGLFKNRKEPLEDFLVKFFNKWNEERSTLYSTKNEVQTPPGKRRSIGDIYSICKYYYPNCTIREVSDIVYNKLTGKVPNFRSSLCSMIKKRVFYKGLPAQVSCFYDTEKKDEFELTVNDWKIL